MKWSDILRADKIKVTHQGTVGLTRWLHKQFEQNRPFDEMAREILTAQGPVQSESPAAFFKAVDQPAMASRAVSQLLPRRADRVRPVPPPSQRALGPRRLRRHWPDSSPASRLRSCPTAPTRWSLAAGPM